MSIDGETIFSVLRIVETEARVRKRVEQLWADLGWFGLLILATDLLFVGLNLVQLATPYLQDARFSIEREIAYAEVFQYLKEYWLACLFFYLAAKRRESLFLVFGLTFAYILVDDWFQFHETAGALISAKLSFPSIFGLRPRDLGELMVLGGVGSLMTLMFAASYWSSPPTIRQIARQTAVFMAALIAFGVGIDLVHAAIPISVLKTTMGLIEDGGEMLMMSLMCWHAAGLVIIRTAVPAVKKQVELSIENARIACNR